MKVFDRYFLWNKFLEYVDWQPSNSQESSHVAEFSQHDLPVIFHDLEYTKQGWYGTRSFEDAMFLGHNGWEKMAKEVKDLVVNPWDVGINARPWNPIHTIAGSGIDMKAYIAGFPECMFRPNYSVTQSVNIVINVGHSYEIRPAEIVRTGRQIVDIVNAFEINNIHTRIVAMVAVSDYKDLFRTFVVCKDLYDSFDLKRVMFAVAHPSFLRRLWFSMAEREPMEIRNKFGFLFDNGYGKCVHDFEYKNDKNILYFVVKEEKERSIIKNQISDIAKSKFFAYSEFNQNLQNLTLQPFIKLEKTY